MPTAPSFGDVTGEYTALRESVGLVGTTHDVVWVTGPDAVRFLDGLLSRAIERIAVGDVARSLLLAPQGKLRATLHVLRGEDRVGLVADAGRGDVVAEDLTRFKIRVDVAISPEERSTSTVWGPTAPTLLGSAGLPVPDPGTWKESAGATVASLPFTRSALPRYLIVGADDGALQSAGAVPVGTIAADSVRIEAGEPIMGVDLDEKTIPAEGLVVEGAVDFDKGCYLGQELVARIDSRGHVNRVLRGVVIGATVLPPVGAALVVEDSEVGSVTSVGESMSLRAPVAMAMVRREVDPEAEVVIRWVGGTAPAVVRELPLDTSLGT